MRGRRCCLVVLATLLLASPVWGTDERAADFAAAEPGGELSADEIYDRYAEARTKESFQTVRIVSRDPGGSEQLSRFGLRVQDARDADGKAVGGVRFNTRIDVDDPFDMRHTSYLIISKEGGKDDEFVYQPSARRVRRVELSDTSFLGTDYTFGDFAVEDAGDAEHTRHPDEEIDGQSVYVIETQADESADVLYPKRIVYLEKQHYLPLRTRAWDDVGVEVKEMTAPADKIREFDGVWVATESTMRDLQQNTSSTLFIDELDPKPKFNRGVFSSGRLGRGK